MGCACPFQKASSQKDSMQVADGDGKRASIQPYRPWAWPGQAVQPWEPCNEKFLEAELQGSWTDWEQATLQAWEQEKIPWAERDLIQKQVPLVLC